MAPWVGTPSVGEFVGFDGEERIGVCRVIVDDVVLEVVGIGESQLAIRALVDVGLAHGWTPS
jgi:hypothetical protein